MKWITKYLRDQKYNILVIPQLVLTCNFKSHQSSVFYYHSFCSFLSMPVIATSFGKGGFGMNLLMIATICKIIDKVDKTRQVNF